MKLQKTVAYFLLFLMIATIVFAAWTPPSFPIDLKNVGAIVNATDVNTSNLYANKVYSNDWTNFTNLGNGLYLGISATAANSQLLDSHDSSVFFTNDTTLYLLVVGVNDSWKLNDTTIYTAIINNDTALRLMITGIATNLSNVNTTANIKNLGFIQSGTFGGWLSDARNITVGSLNDTQIDNNITINTSTFVLSPNVSLKNSSGNAKWEFVVDANNNLITRST